MDGKIFISELERYLRFRSDDLPNNFKKDDFLPIAKEFFSLVDNPCDEIRKFNLPFVRSNQLLQKVKDREKGLVSNKWKPESEINIDYKSASATVGDEFFNPFWKIVRGLSNELKIRKCSNILLPVKISSKGIINDNDPNQRSNQRSWTVVRAPVDLGPELDKFARREKSLESVTSLLEFEIDQIKRVPQSSENIVKPNIDAKKITYFERPLSPSVFPKQFQLPKIVLASIGFLLILLGIPALGITIVAFVAFKEPAWILFITAGIISFLTLPTSLCLLGATDKRFLLACFLFRRRDSKRPIMDCTDEFKPGTRSKSARKIVVKNIVGICPICQDLESVESDVILYSKSFFNQHELFGKCTRNDHHKFTFPYPDMEGKRVDS